MAGEVADKDIILQNLDKLRNDGEYCDLSVIVDAEKFRCHRFVLAATSGYFSSLFKSSFPDSTAPEIFVKDVDAKVFGEILTYLYTGEIKITLENAYDVLKCSDYLVMTKLKENVIKFIEKNPLVENALKICCFALSPMGDPKFAKIVTNNAAINFLQIIQTDDFLNTDFELLESILQEPNLNAEFCDSCHEFMMSDETEDGVDCWTCEGCHDTNIFERNEIVERNESLMFSRFADWIMHRVFERLKYFPKLATYAALDVKYVDKWEAVISKFASQVCPSIDDLIAKKSIHVYAMTENHGLVNFLWDSKDDCWIVYEHFEMPFQEVKGLTMQKKQYFLSKKSTEDGIVNQFWIGEKQSHWSELQSPPVFGKKFRITCISNSIYLYMYNKTLIRNYEALPSTDFEPGTSSINIYAYAVDWNKWFIIPSISKPLFHSYLVSANDMLFVIGGTTSHSLDGSTSEKILQCFDPRTSQWTQKSLDVDLTLLGEACTYGNKIFICEEIKTDSTNSSRSRKIYAYDVISDKWETVTGRKNEKCKVGATVVYDDRLWIFSNYVNCRIETYNLKSKTWNEVSTIPESVKIDLIDSKVSEILYVLIF